MDIKRKIIVLFAFVLFTFMSLAFLSDSPETIHKKEQLIFNAEEPLENSIESTTQESARSSSSEYILVDKVYAIEGE